MVYRHHVIFSLHKIIKIHFISISQQRKLQLRMVNCLPRDALMDVAKLPIPLKAKVHALDHNTLDCKEGIIHSLIHSFHNY